MSITAFGHALDTLHDGLTILEDGAAAPMPLLRTRIAVNIRAGLATIRTSRRFRNAEARPIEAVLTMPVGFDAVVTGLWAKVDGRKLLAVAKPRQEARADYEGAIDAGKLAVLHEEVLRGVHALSVGNLAPGADVEVELETVCALSVGTHGPFLRIPVTVGQLYGASPLAPADDLVTSANVLHRADLSITVDEGEVMLAGSRRIVPGAPVTISLDTAIELHVMGGRFGRCKGIAADGRQVQIDLRPVVATERPLDLSVLVDHSGSTASRAGGPRGLTIWEAIRDGLQLELGRLRHDDRIALWQFDDTCQRLGMARGAEAAKMVLNLNQPQGGTDLANAVKAALAEGARDILVLTDGQTWAATVDQLLASQARISAILVGPNSLDANIGQLCAMTGGQLFYAPGDDVAFVLAQALTALRRAGGAATGQVLHGILTGLVALRGGVEINAQWATANDRAPSDAAGRYAAALALPLLDEDAAEPWARAHSLCTHRTSLILIDEAGEAVEGMAQMRKVALMQDVRASSKFVSASASFAASESRTFRDRNAPTEHRSLMFSRSKQPETETRPAAPRASIQGFFDASRPVSFSENTRRCFKDLRWEEFGDAFLQGDILALDPAQSEIVTEIAAKSAVRDLALSLGLPVEAVALALIADLCGDRQGLRFTRRVFRDTPDANWAHLKLG